MAVFLPLSTPAHCHDGRATASHNGGAPPPVYLSLTYTPDVCNYSALYLYNLCTSEKDATLQYGKWWLCFIPSEVFDLPLFVFLSPFLSPPDMFFCVSCSIEKFPTLKYHTNYLCIKIMKMSLLFPIFLLMLITPKPSSALLLRRVSASHNSSVSCCLFLLSCVPLTYSSGLHGCEHEQIDKQRCLVGVYSYASFLTHACYVYFSVHDGIYVCMCVCLLFYVQAKSTVRLLYILK